MFEKTMQDLVKGIRSAKGDVNVFISQCMQEIKTELKSTDPFLKSEAVRKLTYLHMLGYDMCWAAFHVVEVMSYERFAHKRIGYTAACQSFTQTTDVVLLCTNLLKKEFGSTSEYEVGLAINVLANIATTDLARDLLSDVVSMMKHPTSYVRKKATLVLYKVFLRYPQGLRLTFDQLKERMDEPDVSVVSCAVNVICELANKKPKNYLGLAPQFFRLLTTSSNNWMLIKVVKLLASLVPEEPRLARKLLDPLATVIQNTPAKSLLYECISTVTTALLYTKKNDGTQPRNVPAVVRLCNDHLRRFIEDQDQNLRYLGLVGLSQLMESHSYVIMEHQALIVECLGVDDVTIRMRSLELLVGMVSVDNASEIIRELMRQTLSADGLYRQALMTKILDVCSINKYENIHDFEWYIHVLVQLARIPSSSSTTEENHGIEVARQLLDIGVRVKSIRSILVQQMIELLMESEGMNGPGASTLCEVYYAAAWITGEYIKEYVDEEEDEDEDEDESDEEEKETEEEKLQHIQDLVDEMLQPRTTSFPSHVQNVYMQTLLKLLTILVERTEDEPMVEDMATMILERLPAFLQSEHIEVQERAIAMQQIVLALGLGYGSLSQEERASRAFDQEASIDPTTRLNVLQSFFSERLAPIGSKAQRKVPCPTALDLEQPLDAKEAAFLESGGDVLFGTDDDLENALFGVYAQAPAPPPLLSSTSSYQEMDTNHSFSEKDKKKKKKKRKDVKYDSSSSSEHDEEEDRADALEQERLRTDPFYLASHQTTPMDRSSGFSEMLEALERTKKTKKTKGREGEKKKKKKIVLEEDVMPDGARSSEEERRHRTRRSKARGVKVEEEDLAAVDLTMPLREDERMPDAHLYHHQVKESEKPKKKSKASRHEKEEKEKKHKKKRHEEAKENRMVNTSEKKKKKSREHENHEEERSSTKRSSKQDRALKEHKSSSKKKKSSSSKQKTMVPEEPLLMF